MATTGRQEQWPIIRAQPRSFFRAPLCQDLDLLDAMVAFIGVPFDQGTFGRPRRPLWVLMRSGTPPRAYAYSDPLGNQSEAEGFFDIDTGGELLRGITMADCGNITVVPSDVTGNFDKLTRAVEKVAEQGALPVVVGGDHAITFPAVRGLSKFCPARPGPLRCSPGLHPRRPGRVSHPRESYPPLP